VYKQQPGATVSIAVLPLLLRVIDSSGKQNTTCPSRRVERQNAGVQWAINKYPRRTPASNSELAAMLNIQLPEAQWQHCYQEHNIQVEII